jgi:hypothetical protein
MKKASGEAFALLKLLILFWLAFLNTVRTERFDQVLEIRALLPPIARAA